MTLGELYRFALTRGMKDDPRGEEGVRRILAGRREAYGRLEEEERARFDTERLTNPYGDLRIVWGKEQTEVRGFSVGLTPGAEEVVAARILRDSGAPADLLVSYSSDAFPSKVAFADVRELRAELLSRTGVSANRAWACVQLGQPGDRRAEDLARLLDVPVLVVGSVVDLMGYAFLMRQLQGMERVWEVLEALCALPECRALGIPELVVGDLEGRAGRVYWGPLSEEGFRALAEVGVGTVLASGLRKEYIRTARRFGMHLVRLPRDVLPSLGMNLLLDEIKRNFGELSVFPCANFVRVERDVRS